ncbi:hypothetical protein, partial [Streptococcus pneumoniae]|uniref:hypothetical protein n=1 Tax=Streptococcus pneumoniae TaxID=1313 RepID=UPI001E5DA802
AFHDPTLYPSNSFTHFLIPYWGNASGINSITATYKDKNNNTLNTAVLSDTRLAGYLRQYNIGNGSTRTVRMDITGDVSLT